MAFGTSLPMNEVRCEGNMFDRKAAEFAAAMATDKRYVRDACDQGKNGADSEFLALTGKSRLAPRPRDETKWFGHHLAIASCKGMI